MPIKEYHLEDRKLLQMLAFVCRKIEARDRRTLNPAKTSRLSSRRMMWTFPGGELDVHPLKGLQLQALANLQLERPGT